MVDAKYKRIYAAAPDYYWIYYPENGDSPSDHYESVEQALKFVNKQTDAFIFRSWPNEYFPAYVHYGCDNTIEMEWDKYTTQHLLAMRSYGYRGDAWTENHRYEDEEHYNFQDKLREVLATREHVDRGRKGSQKRRKTTGKRSNLKYQR